MPCWLKQTTPVDLGPGTSIELLTEALKSLGFAINNSAYSERRGYTFSADAFYGEFARMSVMVTKEGKVEIGGAYTYGVTGTEKVNAIKRAYSIQVVKATAQRFGWRLQEKKENQFVAMRRA